jgi:plastocyanin
LRSAAALAFLLAAATSACAGNDAPTAVAKTTTTMTIERVPLDGKQVVVHGRATVTGQISVEANDNYFAPNVLSATPGATITLHVVNNGQALHNISVTEQGINHDLAPNDAFDTTVEVPTSGQLLFFCRIHRDESGMDGVVNLA